MKLVGLAATISAVWIAVPVMAQQSSAVTAQRPIDTTEARADAPVSPPQGHMVDPTSIVGVMQQPKHVYPAAVMPAAKGDYAGLATVNGRIAWNMIDMWFNQKKAEEAFEKYVSRTEYFNHNSPDLKQTFEAQKSAEARDVPPAAHFVIRQVVVQGELVVLHIEATAAPFLPIDELVIFLRVRNGKVIDHWDFHTPLANNSNIFKRMNR